ncbi:MAG: VanZ family protein [Isosphaeraceae bacterium]
MRQIRLLLLCFGVFLGLVVYAADIGVGQRYWGWLESLPMGDKIGHCSLMFTLSLLTNLALRCRALRPGRPVVMLGTLVVLTLVLAEEFSQIWIPGRDFDFLDIAADLVGIGCGDLAARFAYQTMEVRKAHNLDYDV